MEWSHPHGPKGFCLVQVNGPELEGLPNSRQVSRLNCIAIFSPGTVYHADQHQEVTQLLIVDGRIQIEQALQVWLVVLQLGNAVQIIETEHNGLS